MIGPLGPLAGPGRAGFAVPESGFGGVGSKPSSVGSAGGEDHLRLGVRPLDGSVAGVGEGGSPGGSFLDALGEAVARLNDQLTAADAAAADFASGGSTDLHDVVLALSEAGLGLRLGVAVRDRLLEAYQDVMRLQI